MQNQNAVTASLKVNSYCILAFHDRTDNLIYKVGVKVSRTLTVFQLLKETTLTTDVQVISYCLPSKHDPLNILFQCSANVADGGPTLKEHWFNVSCLLGNWHGNIACFWHLQLSSAALQR